MTKSPLLFTIMTAATVAALLGCGRTSAPPAGIATAPAATAPSTELAWADSFALGQCTQSATGRNDYFILEPGFQLVLASATEQVAITVLDETTLVDGIEARVVEEREFENGRLKEVSRNFFTICREHHDVFYLGEDVDDYENGRISGHGGAWRAGVNGARAGLMMPGAPRLGYRHYQEVAPGVAMDRGEIVAIDATVECPAGEFKGCLKVKESSEIEPGATSVKIYARGVGMVFDDGMVLIDSGIGRRPPTAPIAVPAAVGHALAEVEVPADAMPAAVASTIKRLHPTGLIREVKHEDHGNGREIYAVEVMIGEAKYDVELAPDGAVLRNEKE